MTSCSSVVNVQEKVKLLMSARGSYDPPRLRLYFVHVPDRREDKMQLYKLN